MTRYRVSLTAIASAIVEVEAEDIDEAIDLAFEKAPAGVNISNDFDMEEWTLSSDLWPDRKIEDDVEVIG